MMNCETARDRLLERLYDELPPDQVAPLDAHLIACEECTELWKELTASRRMLDRLPATTTGGLKPSRVHQRVAQWNKRRRRLWQYVALASIVAAMTLGFAGVWNLRFELHETRVVVAWGAAVRENASTGAFATRANGGEPVNARPDRIEKTQDAATAQSEPTNLRDDRNVELDALSERIASLESLTRVTAGELLTIDERRTAELQDVRRRLATLQRQSDNRWRLLLTDADVGE